jgi:5-(carboxyamino)imidazole ribonucleotide synthase
VSNHFPTVGVIGAGQLARMSVAPAAALGVNLLLLANDAHDSGAQITNHVVGDYRDLETVRAFARKCDVITFEHELIPLSIIKTLEADGVVVRPSSASFIFSQDKAAMRERLSKFPSPKNAVVTEAEEVREFPVIAKAISGGYDGRGVWKINTEAELAAVLKEVGKVLIEELIDFDYEIAVMVARSPHGQATTWAPTQTIQRDGICVMTITPAPELSNELSEKAQKLALDIANDENRDLAITNKILAYLQAGLYILASDISAHQYIFDQHGNHGVYFSNSKTENVLLIQKIKSEIEIIRLNKINRYTCFKQYCWENESIILEKKWDFL